MFTFEDMKNVIKTIPTQMHLWGGAKVIPDETGDISYMKPGTNEIHVGYAGITVPATELKLTEQEQYLQIRAVVWHEVLHVIYSYTDISYLPDYMNIFEDERIETYGACYIKEAPFKDNIYWMNGIPKGHPEMLEIKSALNLFYAVVRFRYGPKELVKRVMEIIKKYEDCSANTWTHDKYRDYDREVYELLRQCEEYFDTHSKPEDEENNSAGNSSDDSEGTEEKKSQSSSSSSESETGESKEQQSQFSSESGNEEQESGSSTESSDDDETDDSKSKSQDGSDSNSQAGDSKSSSGEPNGSDKEESDGMDKSDWSKGPDDTSKFTKEELEKTKINEANVKNKMKTPCDIDTEFDAGMNQIVNDAVQRRNQRESSFAGYSGHFNANTMAKAFAKGRYCDYKGWTHGNGGTSLNGEEKINLILTIDRSGSFCDDMPIVEKYLHTLKRIDDARDDFTFSVITLATTVTTEDKEHLAGLMEGRHSDYGNRIRDDIFDHIKKAIKPNYHNFMITLFDGNAWSDTPWREMNHEQENSKVWNKADSVIITDLYNYSTFKKYCPQAEVISTHEYTKYLEKEILSVLRRLMVK